MDYKKGFSEVIPKYYQTDKVMDDLKELTRYQNRLIQSRSKCKTLYVRLLDIIFPELHRMVKSLHNQFVYNLLTNYPSPQKIARARFSSLLKIKRLTADKAHQIQEATKQTIGKTSTVFSLELVQVIENIKHYDKQINQVQEEMNLLMCELNSPITIGNRLGAIILAEIRNIHNFMNPNQLQAFAGLPPAIYQSGQMDNAGHMVKRGSSDLRTCIHKKCYTKAMIRKPYDTDLTDQEWAMIEPYFSKHRTYKWSKRELVKKSD